MTQQPNLIIKRSIRLPKHLLRRLGCLSSLSIFSGGVALAEVPLALSPAPKASVASKTLPAPTPVVALKSEVALKLDKAVPTSARAKAATRQITETADPVPPVLLKTQASALVAEAGPSQLPVDAVPQQLTHPPSPTAMPGKQPTPPVAAPSQATSSPVVTGIQSDPIGKGQINPVNENRQPEAKLPATRTNGSTTKTYDSPDAVIFSDRESGCQFAVGQAQGAEALCQRSEEANAEGPTDAPIDPQVQPLPTQEKPTQGKAAKASGLSNVISDALSKTVRPGFSGRGKTAAAGRSAGSTASTTPVRVGPFSMGNSGIGVNRSAAPTGAPSSGNYVQNYYNRTIRPIGLPGNGNIAVLFPLSIPVEISSVFGLRTHPITGMQRVHTGSDLAAPMGTPVLAALTGRVIMADFFGGYGMSIALEHANGARQTLYAHLSEIFVKPGDVVQQGTAIGRVGSTGSSTGPHLHFEYRQQLKDGTWVAQDPGFALETAMAKLVKSLQIAQAKPGVVRKASARPAMGKPAPVKQAATNARFVNRSS